MASLEQTKTYSNKSVDDCFSAAPGALTGAGFELFKSRPIGWLVMSQLTGNEGYITGNISIRPGVETGVTLVISGNKASQETVDNLAQKVWSKLDEGLSK